MRALLIGNYGVGNLGDEALKDYFLQAFPEVQWQVVSASPKQNELPRLPGGLRSLLSTPWLRTIRAMKQADVVVFGGGSLFTDIESSYACFLWWLHARIASLVGTPVFLAFQGIGPCHTKKGEWFASHVVEKASFISVRDTASFDRVKFWKLSTNIIQTFDPVFSLMKAKNMTRSPKNVLTVIPRKNSGESLKNEVEILLKEKKFDELSIVTMQVNDDETVLVSDLTQTATIPVTVTKGTSLEQLLQALSQSSYVVTQRYHGAIAALAMGVPVQVVPQGEGDKLSQLIPYARGERAVEELGRRVTTGEDALRRALHA